MTLLSDVVESPEEYEVVLGCFPRRSLDEAARLIPGLFPDGIEAHLAHLDDVCARVSMDGTRVGVAIIPLDDYLAWCAAEGREPDHGDSRTHYISQRDPGTFPYENCLTRVLDADELDHLLESTYRRLEDQIYDFEERVEEMEARVEGLLVAVRDCVADEGLVTVDLPGLVDDERPGRYSIHVSRDEDGELSLAALDETVLLLSLHLALCDGGSALVRTLERGVCSLRAFALSGGDWSAATTEETARWRADRDDDVESLGGRLALRGESH